MPSPTTSSSISGVSLSDSSSINALIGSLKWGDATGTGAAIAYSFPWLNAEAAVFAGHDGTGNYSSLNEPNASLHYGLNTTQQAAARGALQSWANVANIVFSEVAETSTNVGDIRFGWTSASQPQAWGWASYPSSYWPSGGDVWISTAFPSTATNSWEIGSFNFNALIHELGHALGLKHSFQGGTVLPSAQESQQYTVMSYTDHPHSLFGQANGTHSYSYVRVTPDTPMLYDVATMQYLYGANLTYKTGDDTYTFDPQTPFIRTLWDAGGNDTISVANFTKGCIIDLQAGHFSEITIESDPRPAGVYGGTTPTYDGTDNLAIAYGCVIENAIGGSGNDTLIGNSSNNTLNGSAGIDTALYQSTRTLSTLTQTTTGFTVSSSTDGSDTLVSIERLKFTDTSVALDLAGNAGTTAKIIGAVFGQASVANKGYVGIGLDKLDSGMSYQDLMLLALNAKLGSGFSTASEITLLYQNLTGAAPSADNLNYWTNAINTGQYTKASLAIMAADDSLNTNNINLVGLAQMGIEYV